MEEEEPEEIKEEVQEDPEEEEVKMEGEEWLEKSIRASIHDWKEAIQESKLKQPTARAEERPSVEDIRDSNK